MISGEGTTVVKAEPAEVLDFFCDLHRYRKADTKIRRVVETRPEGDDKVVRIRSRLRGLPTPVLTQRVHRSGDSRVDVTDVPSWWNRMSKFRAWVTCTPTDTGTIVTHREELEIRGPLRPIAERFLADWWAEDVACEMVRLARIVDAQEEEKGP